VNKSMIDSNSWEFPLIQFEREVAQLVGEEIVKLVGYSGVVGGALAIEDPAAEMPFFVRLYLDCEPELVADQLPHTLTVNLPSKQLNLPVSAEYTGKFQGQSWEDSK